MMIQPIPIVLQPCAVDGMIWLGGKRHLLFAVPGSGLCRRADRRGQALLPRLTARLASVSIAIAVGTGLVVRFQPDLGPSFWLTGLG